MSNSSFSFHSSKHHYFQAVRARELNCWENVHSPPHVRCHESHFTCQVSHVTCFFFLSFFGQSGGAIWWRVCYQRGQTLSSFFFAFNQSKWIPYLVSISGIHAWDDNAKSPRYSPRPIPRCPVILEIFLCPFSPTLQISRVVFLPVAVHVSGNPCYFPQTNPSSGVH